MHAEGGATFTGEVSAPGFSGNGASLTDLNASALTTGTMPDARLGPDAARRSSTNTFTGNQTVSSGSLRVDSDQGLSVRMSGNNYFNSLMPRGPGEFTYLDHATNGLLVRSHAGGTRMLLDAGGNLGIGTTTPASRLDVNGTVRATGFQGPAGAVPDAILTPNVARRTGGNDFTGNQTITSGRLGVGTTNPQRLLQVGDINVLGSEGMIRLASTSAAGDASRAWDLGVPQTGGNASGIGYSFIIDDPFVGNNQPEFLIRWDTGYVGLGTTNPGARLHVQNDFNSAFITPSTPGNSTFLEFGNQLGFRGLIGADGLGFSGSSNTFSLGTWSAAPVKFFTTAAQRMIIAADGNVGIGTTDPGLNDVKINNTFMSANGYGLVVSRADYGADVQINRPAGTGGIGLLVDNAADGDSSTSLLLVRNNNGSEVAMNVRADGRTQVKELEITGGADLAEPFNITDTQAKPGMVMAIDPDKPGELRVATAAYDRTVAGIISGAGGVRPGLILRQENTAADGNHPVALSGRVYCWVDADVNGAVRPGDLLTTSETPGHAMRATDHARSNGAPIGKAMTKLESGRGLVLVLVSLQ